MELVTKEIREGKHLGEIVWITHYSQPDLDKKALRNVPPTKCLIQPEETAGKKVYYSETYFAPIGKNGEPTKRVISPVDNTGYRSHCGNELFVFTTEAEANEQWNEQVNAVADILYTRAETAKQVLLTRADELTKTLRG